MEQSTLPINETVKPSSKNRVRSVAYPSFSLESSLKMATKIYHEFTSLNFIPVESISKFLDTRGGTFLMQMSSCVQYGLLELKKGEGYKPTPLLEKIMKPMEHENINDLLLECLMKPELYKKLFNDFKDKKLPSESGLTNTLDRLYGVKGNGAITAAKVFFKNINAAKLISSENELKIGTYLPFIEMDSNNSEDSDRVTYNLNNGNRQLPAPGFTTKENGQNKEKKGKEIPIFLKDNREAKVVLPEDFSDEDLNKIVRVLTAYVS